MQFELFPPSILSVSEITRHLRELMESDEILQDVWVQGEISTLSRPASGHIYFTLKDNAAALRCVIWKNAALRLRIPLQTGTAIEAHGYISLYERDGQYQLYIDAVRMTGEGVLFQEFLRLKARLEAEGLFDEQRKRAIPPTPKCIGIVTSATGAALQDMLNTLQGRYPLAGIILAPAAVQGDEAPPQLVAALRALNALNEVDVILIARGGGSMEDMWCFNDERVVRAVAQSRVPVISGVGHETDFTLTDFAADLRAPTPTAAAVLATPEIAAVRQSLLDLSGQLALSVQQNLSSRRVELENCANRLRRASPLWRIQNCRQQLDQAEEALRRAFEHTLALQRATLAGQEAHLRSLDPRAVLQRGYALLSTEDGALVKSIESVHIHQPLRADLADGSLKVEVQAIIKKQEQAR